MKIARSLSIFALLLLAIPLLLPMNAQEGENADLTDVATREEESENALPTEETKEETVPPITSPTFTLERDQERETADGLIFYTDPESGQVTITGYSGYSEELIVPASINGGSVVALAEGAFAQNTVLQLLVLPDSMTTLGASFCEGCSNLRKVVLPADITAIPAAAFRGCVKLNAITLPNGMISIGDMAFEDCVRIGKLDIPELLTEIGYDAFMGCERLIFGAGDNAYAVAYAQANGISLGFTDTFLFEVLLVLILSAVIGAVGYVGFRALKNKREIDRVV